MTDRRREPRVDIALTVAAVLSAGALAAQQPVGGEFRINTATEGRQFNPAVASAADGDFVVVWQGPDSDRDGVFGRRLDGSGNPLGVEFQVNEQEVNEQWFPAVISSAEGDVSIFWEWAHGVAPGYREIQGRLYHPNGAARTGEFQVNTQTWDLQTKPSAAAAGNGDFVVVWTSRQDGSYTDVFGQRFAASGDPVGGEFQVNSYTSGAERDAVVAMDAAGAFIVVWEGAAGIAAQRFDSWGTALGDELDVSPSGAEPAVALQPGGGYVVAWEDSFPYPRDYDVFARTFAADGTPVGEPFQVNTYTTDWQFAPDLAMAEDGDFVVVWASYHQDGSSAGVYGRRYAGAGLHLAANGTCPGPVSVTLVNARPGAEVGVVAAGNANGWVKGGTTCAGTTFEVGEPFQLPPVWIIAGDGGRGSGAVDLAPGRCWLEAIELSTCSTSGAVETPGSETPPAARGEALVETP